MYLGGAEEQTGSALKRYYSFNGQIVALRTSTGVTYLHGDHLGSVSASSDSAGSSIARQYFDPWGQIKSGAVSATTLNYTGQRLDGTGLLYYHARMYDPVLARFVSADSVVPGNASGSLDGIALKPLTVDFHEVGFGATLNGENAQPFWFQLSDDEKQKSGSPWGPANPQALNRYSYVLNGPVRWTDPSGHVICRTQWCGLDDLWELAKNAWDAFRKMVGDYAFINGAVLSYKGADGVNRTIQSRVKENLALRKEAAKLGQDQSDEANKLLKQFLDGNTSPGIGNKPLPGSDIFYLRGRDGARIFMRQVGKDSYEILAYADKNNEKRVIQLLYDYYVK